MLRKIVGFLVIAVAVSASAQTGVIEGFCNRGGQSATVSGLNSTNRFQNVINSCTISVYQTGTTTLVPGNQIFSNSTGTVLGNPFTADASGSLTPGRWLFFISTATAVDVIGSGGIAPNTYPAPVPLCIDCYASSQFTVNTSNLNIQHNDTTLGGQFAAGPLQTLNFDDTLPAPDAGYQSVTFKTDISTARVSGEVPNTAIQMAVTPPVGGNYVILRPTVLNFSGGSSACGSGVGWGLSIPADTGGLNTGGACSTAPSGFSLTGTGVSAGSVTAVYAFADSSYQQGYFYTGPSTGGGMGSLTNFECGGASIPNPTSTYGQHTSGLTSITGSGIASATCLIATYRNSSIGSKSTATYVNVPDMGLIVYYSGSPVTQPSTIYVAPPLTYNAQNSTLGLDPVFPNILFPFTIETLPAPAGNGVGQLAIVTDAKNSFDSFRGGGSNSALLYSIGAGWSAYQPEWGTPSNAILCAGGPNGTFTNVNCSGGSTAITAPSIVQAGVLASFGGGCNATATLTAGNALVVEASNFTGISDTRGDSFASIYNLSSGSTGAWIAPNVAGGSTIITATASGSCNGGWMELSHVPTSSPIDGTTSTAYSANTGSYADIGPLTTTQPNDLIVSVGWLHGCGSTVFIQPAISGYTAVPGISPDGGGGYVVSGLGTGAGVYNATWSPIGVCQTIGRPSGYALFAIKGVSGGSGTVTNIATGTGLTGGPITTTGTISCVNGSSSVKGCVEVDGLTITASGGVISAVSGGGTTTNPLTMNNSGSGAASGTTFNGSTPETISYNTIGAAQAPVTPVVSSTCTNPSMSNASTVIDYQISSTCALTLPSISTVYEVGIQNGSTQTMTVAPPSGTITIGATTTSLLTIPPGETVTFWYNTTTSAYQVGSLPAVAGSGVTVTPGATGNVFASTGGSSGVQYLPSTAVQILIGDSRFIRYSPSPFSAGTTTCTGSPTFQCTIAATANLPSTTYGVTFNGGFSPSCIAVTWYPVVSVVPGTSFTISAPGCSSTSGTGGNYWDEKYNIGGYIQQSPFGSHGTVLNLATGSQTLSTQVSSFNTLYKPAIDACVAANSGHPEYCIVLIHTAAQDYINGAPISPASTSGTVEYNFGQLWTLIHNEGAQVWQATTVCSPGLRNLSNLNAVGDCSTVNLWLETQGQYSEANSTSTAYWDNFEDWNGTLVNPEMTDSSNVHFTTSGTLALAQKHNQALAAKASTDIAQWASIWGTTFYGSIGQQDLATSSGQTVHGSWARQFFWNGTDAPYETSSDGVTELDSKRTGNQFRLSSPGVNVSNATECFALGGSNTSNETACEYLSTPGWWDLSSLHTPSLIGDTTAPTLGSACAAVTGTTYGYWKLTQDGIVSNCDHTTHLWTQPFSGGGSVTAVSIATANGFSGSSSGGSTPALTIVAGAITPTSTNGVSAATMAYVDATSSIQTQLNAKAPLASPTFTGVPAAPTATGGTSTTQLATTAFVQAAIAAAGTGAGIVTYSGPSGAFSGTQYFPIGGGATASATETNVDIDSPAAVTIQNMTVQMSVAPGVGNSVVYTWRKNATNTALTCTISGASATSCSDTTHNFSTSALDLLDIQAVETGSTITSTVVMAAQLGVSAVATVSSFSGDGALLSNSLSVGAVTATLATAGAHKFWGNNTGSTATPGYQSIGNADIPSSLAPTTLVATGIVDGQAPITITTGASATLGGTYSSGYTYNQEATAATAITYTLPTAVAGKQYCVGNSYNGSAATTGTLELLTSASGQFIIFTDGTLSATGGYVISGGAAADAACVVGVDSTHWQLYVNRGTWTKH